jgi:hypothetical protein
MAVVFAGGSGIAIWFAVKQHKASSSSTSAQSIDPVTGLPYSEDNETDPLTGESYLAEAQTYGSVSAAENAVAGESSIDYSNASSLGSGLVGSSTGQDLVPASEVQGTTYASNAAWAQAVEAGLTDIGYTSTDVAAALGRYLGGLSETSAQATIVQAAVAEYGTPPVGSFQIIQAPPATTTPTGTTTTTTTTKAGSISGLTAKGGTTSAAFSWHAASNASQGYHYVLTKPGGAVEREGNTSSTSIQLNSIPKGVTYNFGIQALPGGAGDNIHVKTG